MIGKQIMQSENQDKVGKTHKKKIILFILLIVAVILIITVTAVAFLMTGNQKEEKHSYRVIQVVSFAGDVTYERDQKEREVFENMNLASRDIVRTGTDSNLELLADSDKHIAAESDTCFSVKSSGDEKAGKLTFSMQYGTALYQIDNPLNEDSSFKVETPNATLSVRGTIFRVTYDPDTNTTILEVTEGKVEAEVGGNTYLINAGEQAIFVDDREADGSQEGTDSQEETGLQEGAGPENGANNFVSWADAGLADHVMDWQDENLEAAMRKLTGIADRDIMLSDVWELQKLELEGKKISNIHALGELLNLTSLQLSFNQISDIAPVSNLTNLTDLGLAGNEISDITPVSNLTNLTGLWLGLNQISDITPVSNLTNLVSLALEDNQISDITPVSNLTNLELLALNYNQISAITPVSNLTNLRILDLIGNQISDIAPVTNLTNLTRLWLSANRISDITPISNLTKLETLKLIKNQITDYSVLDKLPNLTELDIER